jgi:Fic family protein
MHSLDPNYLKNLGFSGEQLKTISAIGQFRGQQALWFQQVPEVLKSLQNNARIESAESSNRLEGITAGPGRVERLVEEKEDPRGRSEQEISGYRDALELIHVNSTEMGLTPNIILQLHQTIYRYLPDEGGVWKNAPNEIIETLPDGTRRVRFIPTPPHLTPTQMQALCEHCQRAEKEGVDPLILIPLFVLDFLCIHPFRDGNGRMARLLTLLMLYHFNFEVGRYISLERVIEQSKETYYESLEKSSQGWHEGEHDVMPWLNYFWGVLLAAYREFKTRVDTARPVTHGGKTEIIRLAVLRQAEPFSLSELEVQCPGVSREMVRHVLAQLRDEGLIEARGHGRGARWHKLNHQDDET